MKSTKYLCFICEIILLVLYTEAMSKDLPTSFLRGNSPISISPDTLSTSTNYPTHWRNSSGNSIPNQYPDIIFNNTYKTQSAVKSDPYMKNFMESANKMLNQLYTKKEQPLDIYNITNIELTLKKLSNTTLISLGKLLSKDETNHRDTHNLNSSHSQITEEFIHNFPNFLFLKSRETKKTTSSKNRASLTHRANEIDDTLDKKILAFIRNEELRAARIDKALKTLEDCSPPCNPNGNQNGRNPKDSKQIPTKSRGGTTTPSGAGTTTPSGAGTTTPSGETPTAETPTAESPETPTAESPETPTAESPETPTAENPETPTAESPETPTAENPEDPTAENPEDPNAENPEDPNAENPEDPNAENPEDPNASGSGDPSTGSNKTPNTPNKKLLNNKKPTTPTNKTLSKQNKITKPGQSGKPSLNKKPNNRNQTVNTNQNGCKNNSQEKLKLRCHIVSSKKIPTKRPSNCKNETIKVQPPSNCTVSNLISDSSSKISRQESYRMGEKSQLQESYRIGKSLSFCFTTSPFLKKKYYETVIKVKYPRKFFNRGSFCRRCCDIELEYDARANECCRERCENMKTDSSLYSVRCLNYRFPYNNKLMTIGEIGIYTPVERTSSSFMTTTPYIPLSMPMEVPVPVPVPVPMPVSLSVPVSVEVPVEAIEVETIY